MGNNASSSGRGHQDETVDFGALVPQGVYTGPRDWNQDIVTQLIIDRKLAPFYRPLEDYEESWDDDQILAARKDFPPEPDAGDDSAARSDVSHRPAHHGKRPSAYAKEIPKQSEAAIYRGAVECPICFLYYPSNINHSRCCDQAICTECFVQIKRAEPTATHLVSEPAACPYCVRENFGVTYTPPSWRAGIGSEASIHPITPRTTSQQSIDSSLSTETGRSRRKSISADSDEVVTTDQIRPDWEAKLAAVRATVARRANRRIIMRQVGDRLIPVGITSGRIQAFPQDGTGDQGEAPDAPTEGRSSRRSRRRQQQQQELNQILGTIGIGGQDLEELMVMEAMRLSLLEHEEQQKREADQKRQEAQSQANTDAATSSSNTMAAPSNSAPMDIARNAASSRLATLVPPSDQTPSSFSSSPGSHPMPTTRVGALRNRSPSPLPGSASDHLSASISDAVGSRIGSSASDPSIETRPVLASVSSGDVNNLTRDEAPLAPTYVRLHSTAGSVSEQPLLKRSGTSDTLEESSTEVN